MFFSHEVGVPVFSKKGALDSIKIAILHGRWVPCLESIGSTTTSNIISRKSSVEFREREREILRTKHLYVRLRCSFLICECLFNGVGGKL